MTKTKLKVIADLHPPESYSGEPDIFVKSFVHTVQVEEGRSASDRR